MSLTPYLSIAILSIPRPEAIPVLIFLIPAHSITAWFSIPAPRISIHPVCLHKLQACSCSKHFQHCTSTSKLGSVKGK